MSEMRTQDFIGMMRIALEHARARLREDAADQAGGLPELAAELRDDTRAAADHTASQDVRLTDDGASDRHHLAVQGGHPRLARHFGGRRAAPGGPAALDELEDPPSDTARAVAYARR